MGPCRRHPPAVLLEVRREAEAAKAASLARYTSPPNDGSVRYLDERLLTVGRAKDVAMVWKQRYDGPPDIPVAVVPMSLRSPGVVLKKWATARRPPSYHPASAGPPSQAPPASARRTLVREALTGAAIGAAVHAAVAKELDVPHASTLLPPGKTPTSVLAESLRAAGKAADKRNPFAGLPPPRSPPSTAGPRTSTGGVLPPSAAALSSKSKFRSYRSLRSAASAASSFSRRSQRRRSSKSATQRRRATTPVERATEGHLERARQTYRRSLEHRRRTEMLSSTAPAAFFKRTESTSSFGTGTGLSADSDAQRLSQSMLPVAHGNRRLTAAPSSRRPRSLESSVVSLPAPRPRPQSAPLSAIGQVADAATRYLPSPLSVDTASTGALTVTAPGPNNNNVTLVGGEYLPIPSPTHAGGRPLTSSESQLLRLSGSVAQRLEQLEEDVSLWKAAFENEAAARVEQRDRLDALENCATTGDSKTKLLEAKLEAAQRERLVLQSKVHQLNNELAEERVRVAVASSRPVTAPGTPRSDSVAHEDDA